MSPFPNFLRVGDAGYRTGDEVPYPVVPFVDPYCHFGCCSDALVVSTMVSHWFPSWILFSQVLGQKVNFSD